MNLLDNLSQPSPFPPQSLYQKSGIHLFAEGKTRLEFSSLGLPEPLYSFFRLRTPDSFLVLPSYLDNCYALHFCAGFPNGLYIAFTSDSSVDLAVPGAHYSFAQLHLALTLGEIDALGHAGRFIIRLHLIFQPAGIPWRVETPPQLSLAPILILTR